MRRLRFLALVPLLLATPLAGCSQPARNVFIAPPDSPLASPRPKPNLPVADLQALRLKVWAGLAPRLGGGHLQQSWGAGQPYGLTGPYPDAQPSLDALGLLALRSATRMAPVPPPPAAGAEAALTAAVLDGFHQLDGPQGAAYMLLSRAQGFSSLPDSPCPDSASPAVGATPDSRGAQTVAFDCARKQVADGLAKAWYGSDSRSFFHVGDASTVYRPIEAFGVGVAITASGYAERDFARIDAGLAIVAREMAGDFDPATGLAYGLMTASPTGSRSATDLHAHLADQAGIAELLMEGFDVSREQSFKDQAARVLQAIVDARTRVTHDGYLGSLDLGGGSDPVVDDFEATALVLEAAHHYDFDDGGRFGDLEMAAAADLVAMSCAVGVCPNQVNANDPGGLPGAEAAGVGTVRSGLVSALAVVAIGEVLTDQYAGAGGGESPMPASRPSASP